MSIEDLTKAFWILNGQGITTEISRVQYGIITMRDGSEYYLEDLVEQYNKEYGE